MHRQTAGLIRRGAELVHLCEQLHVRMFAIALVLLGGAGLFSVPLAQTNPLEGARPLTVAFSALALLTAAYGLAQARKRTGAATTAQLVAMVVAERFAPGGADGDSDCSDVAADA